MNWRESEKRRLIELYPFCTIEELSAIFNRKKQSIKSMANKMKLHKNIEVLKNIRLDNARRNISKMHSENAKAKQKISIKEMIRKERIRIKYGLKQRTKRVFSELSYNEYSKLSRQVYFLRNHGYEVDRKTKIAKYTNDTDRKQTVESKYERSGFVFINDST